MIVSRDAMEDGQEVVAAAPVDARQLVLAGPGTGKTECVAKRMVYLLANGTRPAQILVLSFSRTAVKTLTRRLEKHIETSPGELEELRHLAIRTFDSWTFRMMRLLGSPPADLLRESYDTNISRMVKLLQSKDRDRVAEQLRRIRHVIVDEFQDLGGVRGALVLELLRLLCPPENAKGGFTVLGDEAQAIYGFALRNSEHTEFADLGPVALLDRIRKDYSKQLTTVELRTNHRATKKLAQLTESVRSVLSQDIPGDKKLEAVLNVLEKLPAIDKDLAIDPANGTAAVLARTNGEVIRAASKLSGTQATPPPVPVLMRLQGYARRVPAWIGATLGRMQGRTVTRSQFGKIYAHYFGGSHAQDSAALAIPSEQIAWDRLLTATGVENGANSVDLAVLRERLGWADLVPDDDSVSDSGIHVMTVHQSKGMEFSSVSVMEPSERNAPNSEDEAVEEACVMFVAISRAGRDLKRIPAERMYVPLKARRFRKSGRTRWVSWKNGWVNMEIGVDGDVNPSSFVDTNVHGSTAAVESLQETLGLNARQLQGHKVVLCKHALDGESRRFVYRIHLQKGTEPDLLLGVTSEQLTYDLIERLHGDGYKYSLPGRIFNLRIAEVITLTFESEAEPTVAQPWAGSGLWTGVRLYGTGDFKVYWGKGR